MPTLGRLQRIVGEHKVIGFKMEVEVSGLRNTVLTAT